MKFLKELPKPLRKRGGHPRKDAVRVALIENKGMWGLVSENVAGPQQIVNSMRRSGCWRGFEVVGRNGAVYARYTGKAS
jgi:hypothetical protein